MELTISVDDRTGADVRELSHREEADVAVVAARLLMRAVRAARPRPAYDLAELSARDAEFAAEDAALAESGGQDRAGLLAEIPWPRPPSFNAGDSHAQSPGGSCDE